MHTAVLWYGVFVTEIENKKKQIITPIYLTQLIWMGWVILVDSQRILMKEINKLTRSFLVLYVFFTISCSEKTIEINDPESNNLYFPSRDSEEWESKSPEELSWNTSAIDSLYDFLEQRNTRAFIILKDGRIILENYWGNNITNTKAFDKNSLWYWASAGKTLTAFLVGIAQEQGLLTIEDASSTYLGNGWTNSNEEQESLIKIKHQLTMTTGLDYEVDNPFCTDPNCLLVKFTPGTNWFYHNAPYTLLREVIENASQTSYNNFSDQHIENKIGMSGIWTRSNFDNVYTSTARDMARFGLLALNKGVWDNEVILNDANYFSNMVNSSQEFNEAYGYLWWLNGKSNLIIPGLTIQLNRHLVPNGPEDLIAGLGKNGQFIDVVPSKNMVIIRMGEDPDNSLVPINFHNEMWVHLNKILN